MTAVEIEGLQRIYMKCILPSMATLEYCIIIININRESSFDDKVIREAATLAHGLFEARIMELHGRKHREAGYELLASSGSFEILRRVAKQIKIKFIIACVKIPNRM